MPKLARAFDSPDAKRAYNRAIFTTIAPRYDLITRLLSYGQDARWKRRVAAIVGAQPASSALDLACGTGDVAVALADGSRRVVGLDLTPAMLDLARRRSDRVDWVAGDMTKLPFAPATFDVVTTSYGLRNVPVLDAAASEIARVLRPGGMLVSLDFNRPAPRLMRAVYLGYLTVVGSALGLVLHGDPDTYRYIAHSIRRYPGAEGVAAVLRSAGFADVRIEPKLGGLMTIHVARRDMIA
jgi:demethylmenaquinone methyltransferase/2-methoxy-6-polyprenyl-1,4-benzoquinol methylase